MEWALVLSKLLEAFDAPFSSIADLNVLEKNGVIIRTGRMDCGAWRQ